MTAASPGAAPLPSGFLALPAPGDATLARLLRKVRLLALRTLLELPAAGAPPAQAGPLRRLQEALPEVARADPERLLAAIGSPDVLLPLLALRSGARPAAALLPLAVPHLLLQLGALPRPVRWPGPVARLVDAARGRVVAPVPPAAAVEAGPDGAALLAADGGRVSLAAPTPWERPELLVPLADGPGPPHLALFDDNPLAMEEAHPDKPGNALDLGGREPAAWRGALREALALVGEGLPALRAELAISLARVVPVGVEGEVSMSASFRQGPGVVYLTLHPSPLTMAEALVHETQHGKLNALTWLDPVLDNGYTATLRSPVRPDPRPLMGVLLAVHAFAPVAALLVRLRDGGHPVAREGRFGHRLAEVLGANGTAMETLGEHARPTEQGARVLDAIGALHAAIRARTADVVPVEPTPWTRGREP